MGGLQGRPHANDAITNLQASPTFAHFFLTGGGAVLTCLQRSLSVFHVYNMMFFMMLTARCVVSQY